MLASKKDPLHQKRIFTISKAAFHNKKEGIKKFAFGNVRIARKGVQIFGSSAM